MTSIAINSVQSLQSQALQGSGSAAVSAKLGFFELALLYMALGIGAFFATPLMPKVGGPKVCMAIGSVFDCLWTLGSLLPALKNQLNYTAAETPFVLTDGFIYTAACITSILSGSGEAL